MTKIPRLKASISESEVGRQELQNGNKVRYIQHIIPNSHIYWNYFILFMSTVLCEMSGSSFPAIVDELKADLHIKEGQVGVLATTHYIGSLIGKLYFNSLII